MAFKGGCRAAKRWLYHSAHFNGPTMHSSRRNQLTRCLAIGAAVGVSLCGFASRPPCACVLEASANRCPHCPSCILGHGDNATQACYHQDNRDCPCCDGTPADQPFRPANAGEPSLVDAVGLHFFAPEGAWLEPLVVLTATGGWRVDVAAAWTRPQLAQLCRWII